jgi:hypothetical protein
MHRAATLNCHVSVRISGCVTLFSTLFCYQHLNQTFFDAPARRLWILENVTNAPLRGGQRVNRVISADIDGINEIKCRYVVASDAHSVRTRRSLAVQPLNIAVHIERCWQVPWSWDINCFGKMRDARQPFITPRAGAVAAFSAWLGPLKIALQDFGEWIAHPDLLSILQKCLVRSRTSRRYSVDAFSNRSRAHIFLRSY